MTDILPEKEINEVKTMQNPVKEQAEIPVEKLPAKIDAAAAVEAKPQPQPVEGVDARDVANDNIPLESSAKAE